MDLGGRPGARGISGFVLAERLYHPQGGFISYLRVSTDRQGGSGLGLEAQRAEVARYLNGGDWTVIAEFVEVETHGAPASRSACRRQG